MTNLRSSAWPTQGGLPSINDANAFRGQIPTLPPRNPVLGVVPHRAFTTVPIKPAVPEIAIKAKTPSPRKIEVKIEAATGKENVNITPQSNH